LHNPCKEEEAWGYGISCSPFWCKLPWVS
jgi:hypothetical protein